MSNFKEDILDVKAFVFDCDGVLTDGSIITLPDGEALRAYNSKDGFAISCAIKCGYPVAIISGGKGVSMEERFKRLKIEHVYLAQKDKLVALNDFSQKTGVPIKNMLFMGDDLPDVAAMMACGVATAPCDAVSDVKRYAKYISNYDGGRGCVRDVIEQVLKAQEVWPIPQEGVDIASA